MPRDVDYLVLRVFLALEWSTVFDPYSWCLAVLVSLAFCINLTRKANGHIFLTILWQALGVHSPIECTKLSFNCWLHLLNFTNFVNAAVELLNVLYHSDLPLTWWSLLSLIVYILRATHCPFHSPVSPCGMIFCSHHLTTVALVHHVLWLTILPLTAYTARLFFFHFLKFSTPSLFLPSSILSVLSSSAWRDIYHLSVHQLWSDTVILPILWH